MKEDKKYIATIELKNKTILKLEKEDIIELAKQIEEIKERETTIIKLQRTRKRD